MSDELDPSILALLNNAEAGTLPQEEETSEINFETSEGDSEEISSSSDEIGDVDLSRKHFNPIEKFFEETPSKVFDDPNYYKVALTGEGESSQRLHQLLVKYLNCTDPKDKTVYRQNMVSSYWNFVNTLATKLTNPNIPECKRMLLRYGVVLPSLFSPEQKDFFSRAIVKNTTGEPIYYVDEWFRDIGSGKLTLSATDEAPASRAKTPEADQQRIMQLKSKNNGKLQSSENLLNSKESERAYVESEIQERIKLLFEHSPIIGLEPHTSNYSDMQRKLFAEISERFRILQKIDRELTGYLKEFKEAKEIEESLNMKSQNMPVEVVSVSKEQLDTEINSVRQMAKMTVGRQGNQFPVFTREFFHCFDKSTGFRENVLRELSWIESIDPNCFCRIHKNVPHRIVPYVLLVPTYGDMGFCWEPFDRFNRVTSRGRIIIPMYPRDLKTACLEAVADLRWQVAKEKASYYWMEEGLTGQYYQWFDSQKLKGDLKQYFIEDYVLWMTKEAEGVQRLSKEVRAIFWRFLPFPQDRKDELKKRSVVYQELYQRDINRSMSDGY